jgi:hypothetical protein
MNIARNAIDYTDLCKFTSQLSFALLFSSIRAFSTKRTISKFRSNSRRGHMEHLQRTAALSISLVMGFIVQGDVSILLGFHLHYFLDSLSDQRTISNCGSNSQI